MKTPLDFEFEIRKGFFVFADSVAAFLYGHGMSLRRFSHFFLAIMHLPVQRRHGKHESDKFRYKPKIHRAFSVECDNRD